MKVRHMNIEATFHTTFSAYEMIAKQFKCYVRIVPKINLSKQLQINTKF